MYITLTTLPPQIIYIFSIWQNILENYASKIKININKINYLSIISIQWIYLLNQWAFTTVATDTYFKLTPTECCETLQKLWWVIQVRTTGAGFPVEPAVCHGEIYLTTPNTQLIFGLVKSNYT